MAWTAPRDWAASELVTAALLNTHLRDNLKVTGVATVSAAGDITYATAANALARLAGGTTGQVLSTTGTAIQWGKTLSATVSAAGTLIGTATALTAAINRVTVIGTSGHGVALPAAVAGLEVTVINDDLTGDNTLKVWPSNGASDKIDGGSTDAADTNLIVAGSSRRYIAVDGENWYTETVISGVSSVSGSTGAVVDGDIDHDSLANFEANEHYTQANITTIGTVTVGTISTGAVIKDATMTLGSDADGDMYYRASNVLTRLAKGDDNDTLMMNGNVPNWEAVAAAGGYTQGCRVYQSGAQTIVNNTYTDLEFGSLRYDTDNKTDQSAAPANTRITFTTPGVYVVWGGNRWVNYPGNQGLDICLNGSTVIARVRNQSGAGQIFEVATTVWKFTGEDPDDYVTLQAFQESGGDLDTSPTASYSTEFAAQRIG